MLNTNVPPEQVWCLTWQSQHRLEPAALDGPQRGGGAAHPQTLKLPQTGGDGLRLTVHPPRLRGGAAGLQTPGQHAQNQTHDLQAQHHAASRPTHAHTQLESPGNTWKHLETPQVVIRLLPHEQPAKLQSLKLSSVCFVKEENRFLA